MTEKYLSSRADTMQSIESTIVELGGIFQQLAHMIKEQEEVMVRIDSNVEDTAMNVEMGHAEILKYFRSVTSNRWLMAKYSAYSSSSSFSLSSSWRRRVCLARSGSGLNLAQI